MIQLSVALCFWKPCESSVTADGKPAPGSQADPEQGEFTLIDTNCISTMFQLASSTDAIIAVTGFITEVDWTSKVRRVPLLELSSSLSQSFEFLGGGRVIVRPGMREQAYGSAMALLHLRVQCLCGGFTEGAPVVASKLSSLLLGNRFEEDHELTSALDLVSVVFGSEKEILWEEFVFSDAHYCSLSYVLRCRAWATLRTRSTLTEDVLGFVRHSFSRELPVPRQVIADCLLIVDMIVGGLPELDDKMLIKDKRSVTYCATPVPR